MAGIVHQALAPFTLKGFYLLTWGAALGTNLWQSLSSIEQLKSLSRDQFVSLQSKVAPAYFATSTALTGTLLLTHLYFHPSLLSSPLKSPHWYQLEEGVQAILIATAFVPQLINLLVRPQDSGPSLEKGAAEAKPTALQGLAAALNSVSALALIGLGLAVSM
ncbi:uncharacterized protein EHS24_001850 [Apiotrichum porosum]|uniref:TMEM205-like domain-containing protein n=1 Tax=Apiotrichum porosum TaxID=105984 RepID=A0A427XJK5_9TREE|nr:uncharacterized protein EHS24_001850 [Apiotrichum porosum]RSH78927.1 hypothetical protein EHS24_001850 [Apiotrichum porosum]